MRAPFWNIQEELGWGFDSYCWRFVGGQPASSTGGRRRDRFQRLTRIRCIQQGPQAAGIHSVRLDSRLCVHAGGWVGKRSPRGLFSLSRDQAAFEDRRWPDAGERKTLMQAIQLLKYGELDEGLQLAEIAEPDLPKPGQILKSRGSAPSMTTTCSWPAASTQSTRTFPALSGNEGAGKVLAVGDGVKAHGEKNRRPCGGPLWGVLLGGDVGRGRQWDLRRVSGKAGQVWVPKAGWVRFRWSRAVPAGVKSYRVTRDRAGRWHVAFAVIPAPVPAPGNGQVVGIDRGVAVAAALSTGKLLHCPALTGREQTRLRRLQRSWPAPGRARTAAAGSSTRSPG